MADWVSLQSSLGIIFDDISLLKQAFVHRSYLNENPDFNLLSNERLEFLGDAVLGLVVAKELYGQYPDLSEGGLTRLRSTLVCGETLARLATSLHLGDYLYLGRGEESTGGRERQSNLAAVVEAVLGAVLLEHGFAITEDLVLRLLEGELRNVEGGSSSTDYKSRLQEMVQARRQITPSYRTVEVVGPDHDRRFTVEVVVENEVLGKGRGRRRQLAENEAARVALEKLGWGEDVGRAS
jgi:ribonuclease-3